MSMVIAAVPKRPAKRALPNLNVVITTTYFLAQLNKRRMEKVPGAIKRVFSLKIVL